ncbi:MAG: Cof-type HAD-IIB family hydrolase [Eubacteriales bacterium]|nr:Cof-type HAD-IIB family hydrolase [Eubacteriales bacterium]
MKEKKYKALAVDLDGTLLNTQHRIGKDDANALKELRQAGVRLITVTGRTLEETLEYGDILNKEGDVAILQGGSHIVWFEETNVRSELKLMSVRDRQILLEASEANGFYPLVFIGEKVYSKGQGSSFHCLFQEMMNQEIFYVEELSLLQEKTPVGKISLMSDRTSLLKTEKEMMAMGLCAPWGRTRINDRDYGIDVTARSKKEALSKILSILNIDRQELIAVGDSENDIEMIEFAGLGIAMGNADKLAKSKADFITQDNDHGGIAHVIRKFFL